MGETTARRALAAAVIAAGVLALLAPPASAQQFGEARQFPAGDGIRALALADFDGDGNPDVLVRQPPGRLALAHGDGEGGLTRVTGLAGPALDEAGDLDGDRLPDLVEVAERGAKLHVRARIADGHGGFGDVVDSPSGVTSAGVLGVARARVDGDGLTDLVVALDAAPSGAELWVASGRGGGAFGAWWRAGASPGERPTALPDLDGDGRAEVALAGAGAVYVHRSDPREGFGPGVEHRVGDAGDDLGATAVGRFAPGAPPALAVANRTRGCIALVAVTAPAGPAPCLPSAGAAEGLAAGDVDGDGVTDLVHGGTGGVVGLLRGRRGTLGEPERAPLGGLTQLAGDPLVGDLDEDGRPDVVVVANLRSLAVLPNVGRPELVLSAPQLVFGARVIGTASDPQALVVRNVGTFALTGLAAALAGPAAGDFAIAVDLCRGLVLAPDAACAVRVRFRPQAGGHRDAALALEGAAAGLPREVPLTGWGLSWPGRTYHRYSPE